MIVQCTKLSDIVQGKAASDVGDIRDCSVFLHFPVLMAITEVPIKQFMFKCERPAEQRRPRGNAFTITLESQNARNRHIPPVRVISIINAHVNLYNDLRRLLASVARP